MHIFKIRFYSELVFFAGLFVLFVACIILKRSYFDYLAQESASLNSEHGLVETVDKTTTTTATKINTNNNNNNNSITETISIAASNCIIITHANKHFSVKCKCAYLYPTDSLRYVILKSLI